MRGGEDQYMGFLLSTLTISEIDNNIQLITRKETIEQQEESVENTHTTHPSKPSNNQSHKKRVNTHFNILKHTRREQIYTNVRRREGHKAWRESKTQHECKLLY